MEPVVWSFCLALATLFVAEYLLALFIKFYELLRIRSKCRGKLILTFDDGPGNILEPRLLEMLRKYGAKATFFLNGKHAETRPDRCDALISAGR